MTTQPGCRLHYWTAFLNMGSGFEPEMGRRMHVHEGGVYCHRADLGDTVSVAELNDTGIREHWTGFGAERWASEAAYRASAAPVSRRPFDVERPQLRPAQEYARDVLARFDTDEERARRDRSETWQTLFFAERAFAFDGRLYATLAAACRAYEAKLGATPGDPRP